MTRTSMTFVAAAFVLLLAVGQASRKSRWQSPLAELKAEDPGHRVVLKPYQHKNGSWEIPKQLLQLRTELSSAGEGLTQKEKDEILGLHNYYRCIHDVPPMTWDQDIAAKAQAFVDQGKYGHSPKPRTVNGENVGENIAWGNPTKTGISAASAWYDEIQFTHGGTPKSCEDRPDPNEDICHYTQVVWAASVKLGCGKGRVGVQIGDRTLDGDFWVCQYGPGGNTGGQFTANVLAPTKSEATCSAPTPPPTPPPPTPPPAPVPPLEETPASDCADMGRMEGPLINDGQGGYQSCEELVSSGFMSYYCENFGFVVSKCRKSCNPHLQDIGGSC